MIKYSHPLYIHNNLYLIINITYKITHKPMIDNLIIILIIITLIKPIIKKKIQIIIYLYQQYNQHIIKNVISSLEYYQHYFLYQLHSIYTLVSNLINIHPKM
jgi:hypothetical protein